MKKSIAVLIAAAAAALLLAACGSKRDQIQPLAANTQNVTMMLDWLPNADHVGIYEAIANGDLKDAGIDLHVETPPSPSASSSRSPAASMRGSSRARPWLARRNASRNDLPARRVGSRMVMRDKASASSPVSARMPATSASNR